MIVSISQPAYLPWLGYFDRLRMSDVAVVLDNVQLERRGFTHRNKIICNAKPIWLTVPLQKKGNYATPICQIVINNEEKWQHKHWQTLLQSYNKAPCFNLISQELSSYYTESWHLLNDMLFKMTQFWMTVLGLQTKTVLASSLRLTQSKSDLILEICQQLGATKYLSGPFGRDYLEREKFSAAGIELLFHDYQHPIYEHGVMPFQPNLSIVDLVAHHGARSLEILSSEMTARSEG